MFKKILIANRGEIAVRIIRTCREMGISTVALYEEADLGSLHVRLADECVRLNSPQDFIDPATIIDIARDVGVEAVHPGYGFVAERPSFVEACQRAAITFIGPPHALIATNSQKLDVLARVREAGFPTVTTSSHSFAELGGNDWQALKESAEAPAISVRMASRRPAPALVRRKVTVSKLAVTIDGHLYEVELRLASASETEITVLVDGEPV